jgi:hypothetical protein
MAASIIGQAGFMVCALSPDLYAETATGSPKSGLLQWHRGEIAGFLQPIPSMVLL